MPTRSVEGVTDIVNVHSEGKIRNIYYSIYLYEYEYSFESCRTSVVTVCTESASRSQKRA